MGYLTDPIEEPHMPCPEVIAELGAILKALPEMEQSIPQTKGWYKTIYEARAAILAPYYRGNAAYKHEQEFKRIAREQRKAKKAAKVQA
jgi:hypothetical protein